MSTTMTDLNTRATARAIPFKLARVEKADAPDGAAADNWYGYVPVNGG